LEHAYASLLVIIVDVVGDKGIVGRIDLIIGEVIVVGCFIYVFYLFVQGCHLVSHPHLFSFLQQLCLLLLLPCLLLQHELFFEAQFLVFFFLLFL